MEDSRNNQGIEERVEFVQELARRIPKIREQRLLEAYDDFKKGHRAYYDGVRIYVELLEQFRQKTEGTERDLLVLYQDVLSATIAEYQPEFSGPGDALLQSLGLGRPPMEYTRQGAIPVSSAGSDSRLNDRYQITVGAERDMSLHQGLREIASGTIDILAAADRLATYFNAYSNFAWFGSSIWRDVVETELLIERLRGKGRRKLLVFRKLQNDIDLGHRMLTDFFRVHREDPTQIKRVGHWYGQSYSYLTRDMIDLSMRLVRHRRKISRNFPKDIIEPLERPSFLYGSVEGSFMEYPDVGSEVIPGPWRRALGFGRLLVTSIKLGREKQKLARMKLDREERLELAWRQWIDWSGSVLTHFGIDLRVRIDPLLMELAEGLDLSSRDRKIVFLPTHQSLLDHPAMYQVLSSPELCNALGWSGPRSCVMLSRTGIAASVFGIGPKSMTMFGIPAERFDRLMEEVDGYVFRDPESASSASIRKLVRELNTRPAVIYPMATTAAFETQLFPLQHSLFSVLPSDTIFIPIALRGIHALWPKTPKNNLRINSGRVEAVVGPPLLGGTTLLPRQRSMRFQLEQASLIHALHITQLLNPETKCGRPSGEIVTSGSRKVETKDESVRIR